MASEAIMDRIDELFQGLDPDAPIHLAQPLVKLQAWADTPEQWTPATTPTIAVGYLLKDGGDPGLFPSHKRGQSIEQAAYTVDLVAYHGGATAVTQNRQQLERTLARTWEEIKALLVEPAVLARGTTGWWATKSFSASPNVVRGDRLIKPTRFTAIYAFTRTEP